MTSSDQPDPAAEPTIAEPVFDAELAPGVRAPSYEEVTGYTQAGAPTFDHVRDKIEKRTATALGSEELAGLTPEVQEAEQAFADRQQAAKDKLDEIRRSMGKSD